MVFKLIACEIFFREISFCAAVSPHTINLELTEKGLHEKSDILRESIQSRIDSAEKDGRAYDAILLGFGLCGNAVHGVRARAVPLVIPRAHDCCTVFLGSRKAFEDRFKDNPSLPFSSAGYMERGGMFMREADGTLLPGVSGSLEELIARYGEENGRYIHETLHAGRSHGNGDRIVFIDVPELSHLGYAEKCREQAEKAGMRMEVISGDMRLLRMLLNAEWDPREFLIVPPGRRIRGVYDWDEIIRAEEPEKILGA
jgi:hypothetical protein